MRMGNSSDVVRFLDNVDLTFALDSRSSSSQQMVSMEISAKPIIFRASYRDINLITSITNKALELYGKSANSRSGNNSDSEAATGVMVSRDQKSSRLSKRSSRAAGSAHVVTTKEQVCTHYKKRFLFIDHY